MSAHEVCPRCEGIKLPEMPCPRCEPQQAAELGIGWEHDIEAVRRPKHEYPVSWEEALDRHPGAS